MTGAELIDNLAEIVDENIEFVEKKCQHFSAEQKNWKPDPSSWSISEVFAHLNRYADYYHPAFKSKVEKTKFRKPTDNFVSSPLGKASWKSMKLGRLKNIKRKFKAPPGYNPSNNPELITGNDEKLFLENQRTFLQTMEAAKEINLRKAKISISLSKIIKFRFGDALMFVIYHDERHIEQIKKIMNHPSFPKKK